MSSPGAPLWKPNLLVGTMSISLVIPSSARIFQLAWRSRSWMTLALPHPQTALVCARVCGSEVGKVGPSPPRPSSWGCSSDLFTEPNLNMALGRATISTCSNVCDHAVPLVASRRPGVMNEHGLFSRPSTGRRLLKMVLRNGKEYLLSSWDRLLFYTMLHDQPGQSETSD